MNKTPINRTHSGPAKALCAVCGLLIDAYESRMFGDEGAAHVWKPDTVAERATCITHENEHKYPYYYTDG